MEKGNKVKILAMLTILMIALLASNLIFLNPKVVDQNPKELEEITIPISWFHGGIWTFIYNAQEKGFFEEQGLKVKIIETKGSAITSQLIGSGEYLIGIVSADTAMISKDKGVPLTVVGVVDKLGHSGITCHYNSNVKTAKDLEGKKVGVTITSNTYQQFLSYLKLNDVDRKKINEVPISGAGQEFLAGKVDCHALTPIVSENMAKIKGIKVNSILYYDEGLKNYGLTIVANSKALQENPELVEKIVNALQKGLEYEKNNPQESLEIMFKQQPHLLKNKEYETNFFDTKIENYKKLPKNIDPFDGKMDPEVWKFMERILQETEMINGNINLEEFYTNEFLSI